jgi:hypothetical protein
MDWEPLNSSVFASVAYSPATQTLYLRFHSGETYCYFEFPPEEYRNFFAADSKGQYFSNNIRDRYRFEHLRHHKHGSH